jgi:tetratricopeptide (TPR) repeat protein
MNNLARVMLEQRRYKDAAPLLEHAIAIGERERGDLSPSMAFAYSNLAVVRSHTERLREAETLFGKAIAIARKNKHPSLGPTLADFAQLMCSTGRTAEGLKLLDEAAPVTRADYPDNSWSAWVENIKGECLLRSGRVAEGKAAIAKSSPVIIKSWPPGTLFAVEAQRRAKLAT